MNMAYEYYKCTSLDQRLPYSHYSNPVWDEPQCVYGDENAPATRGEYSDRLRQWDYQKSEAAWALVSTEIRGTPRAIQEYLSNYHGKAITLVSIQTQTNVGNGYPVHFYRWNEGE